MLAKRGQRCEESGLEGRLAEMQLKALSWMERAVGWDEQGRLPAAELLQNLLCKPKELKERERKT